MSSHPAAALYEPTPIEEAYGIYVYDALFGSFPRDGTLQLEKTTTLKILGKSNVDSIILKTAWNVVAPRSASTLTDMAQFHVLLRLISLAQDGILEQEINRAFEQKNGTKPVDVFTKTLWMTMDEEYPLPTFQGVSIPSQSLLQGLSARLNGTQNSNSPAPTPAPIPLPNNARTPAPVPSPHPTPPPNANTNRNNQQKPSEIDSAIQQLEKLGMKNGHPDFDKMKDLDPENLELLQEQAALQSAIMESKANSVVRTKPPPPKPQPATKPPPQNNNDRALSEEEALQRAIYESTHNAAPAASAMNVAVAAAPKKNEHENWLRMSSLDDSLSDIDKNDDSDDERKVKKKKAPKGDAYAGYVASLDPTSTSSETKGDSGDKATLGGDFDKKLPAKPLPAADIDLKKPAKLPDAARDDRIDEYPQAVQELVMNGFELEKAIQGYKMLGDNFDDIVLFLTSNMTVKELVINGFNIHKVVQAYDLIGDNMDDLLAYLMANST